MAKRTDSGLASHQSGQANRPLTRPAHALAASVLVEECKASTTNGLTATEAKKRLEEFGRNELGGSGGVQPIKILIRQVANAMTLVLILAMAVSFGIRSWIEGAVVATVITLNIVVGFYQEFNAEKTMDSLRSLSSPTANAVRDGHNIVVPTVEIVPGDMVELKTGDTIPADVRLIEALNFESDEALLTGESLPVRKDADIIFEDSTGPGDRLNIAFSSSTVTKGRARGIVFATGMHTEIGSIAAALRAKNSKRRSVKRKPDGTARPHRYAEAWTLTASDAVGRFLGVNVGTPLQKKLSRLALLLFGIAVVCAIIVLAANNFSSNQEVIIYAVATGLSMIPASLIVVLTITMSAGTKRMVERHVIVRNLKSLEALGGVTDICSDKTGTLTQGKMVAKKAWIPSKGTYFVGPSPDPMNPTIGDLAFEPLPPRLIDFSKHEASSTSPSDLLGDNAILEKYLKVASLANLATVQQVKGEWHARGDPTEIAIQVFASRFDYNRLTLTSSDHPQWTALTEFPFDCDVKKMSVIFKENASDTMHVFTKGAVERVIASCTSVVLEEGKPAAEMTDDIRSDILQNMEALAVLGLRVLALASRDLASHEDIDTSGDIDRDSIETELTFQGLIGLYDPPRLESAGSVRLCHQAGIAVHMLTGDHPGTARAIALEVGILPSRIQDVPKDVADSLVMTASQFDALSDKEIDNLPVLPLVVARCAPNTKVRMIESLHRRKRFVAMTGDGVNDSPSLKRADVGIAMGQSGSDVAKDASDIILTDDNFASILNAIEEGRRMFDNIQKFILHLLSQNIAQACTLLIGLIFKDSNNLSVFPISPVEIMWILMITSGLPDMGLGFEAAAPDILSRPPQNLKRGVFTLEVLLDMVVYGLWIAALCLGSFTLVLYGFGNGHLGQQCNDGYTIVNGKAVCDQVFSARATCFACLTWLSLFLAWELLHMRRSFFRMHPETGHTWTQWARDVWANKFLFGAVMAGFVTIFPILYIPGLNRVVFRHEGIRWQWAVVFIDAALFFGGVEAWKWGKRVFFRWQDAKRQDKDVVEDDVEAKAFGAYLSSHPSMARTDFSGEDLAARSKPE